jgi:hypothetical protein
LKLIAIFPHYYRSIRQHGITLALALTIVTFMGFEEDYEDFHGELLAKVERFAH